ncbi:hypothetical protein ACLGI4_18575 [Streptomyces sp. HMX112]|uniref:WXG100 family type VII secretion target n=1 Tax=Streptomyces sp. HMX112 TaxID=3390850 RepID=UPI003A7FD292
MSETGKKPQAGKTPVESMSNEELLAMLQPANKATAEHLAQKLTSAAEVITSIGDDLKLRAGLLHWDGEGAEAFRDWTGATGNATLRLGAYAKEAGKWMSEVAQAIAEAHSGLDEIAKASTAAKKDHATAQGSLEEARSDSGSGKDGKAAATAAADVATAAAMREATRVAAMMKLRKLGQTYTQSGDQMNRLERPKFPPPAGHLGDEWVSSDAYVPVPSHTGGGRSSTGGSVLPHASAGSTGGAVGSAVAGSGTVLPTAEHTGGSGRAVADRPVAMEIDGLATLPTSPTAPSGLPGGPTPPVAKPDGPAFPGLGIIPPAPTRGITAVPNTGGGGRTLPPAARGSVPPGIGTTAPASRLPRENGIVGGRPVPPSAGRPTVGIPRGTVAGAEGPYGRGAMPGGSASAHGTGGAGQSGFAGGRRLATETGGVVGGRPYAQGQTGARPFTPGGSGLVRGGNTGSGPVGIQGRTGAPHVPTARNAGAGRDQRNGERPDYLSEDEETWQQGSRRVVPPVID